MSQGPSFPPQQQQQQQSFAIPSQEPKIVVKRSVIGSILTILYNIFLMMFSIAAINESPITFMSMFFSIFFFCKCLYKNSVLKFFISLFLLLAKTACFTCLCHPLQLLIFLINLTLLLIPSSSCFAKWFYPCYTKTRMDPLIIQNQIINILQQPPIQHHQDQYPGYPRQQHNDQEYYNHQHHQQHHNHKHDELPPPYDKC